MEPSSGGGGAAAPPPSTSGGSSSFFPDLVPVSEISVDGRPGVIGGRAFRDSDNDGRRDDFLGPDRVDGVPDVNVWLLSCGASVVPSVVAHAATSSDGTYGFTRVRPGEYRVVAQAPAGRVFSELPPRGGGGGGGGAPHSTIDPEDGSTACFEVGEGERTTDWDFGLHRPGDGPGVPPTASGAPSPPPPAAIDGWVVEFHVLRPDPTAGSPTPRPASPGPLFGPTGGPTLGPSPGPTKMPSSRPTPEPTSRPSSKPTAGPSFGPTQRQSPTSGPSFRPTVRPSLGPTRGASFKLRPTSEPSFGPTPRPSLRPSSTPSSTPTSEPSSRTTREPSLRPTSRPTMGPTSGPTAGPRSRPSSRPTSGRGAIFSAEHRPTDDGTLAPAPTSGPMADSVGAAPFDSPPPPAADAAPPDGAFGGDGGPVISDGSGGGGGGGDSDRGEIVVALAFLATATLALTGLLLACRRRRRRRRNKDDEGKDDGNDVERAEGPSTSSMGGGGEGGHDADNKGGEDPEPGAERGHAPPAGEDWFKNAPERRSLASISSRLAAEAEREDSIRNTRDDDDERTPPSGRGSSSTVSDAPPLVSLSYRSGTTRSPTSSERVCSSDECPPWTNSTENDGSVSRSVSPADEDEAPARFRYHGPAARPIERDVPPETTPELPPRTLSAAMRGFSDNDAGGFDGGKVTSPRDFSPNDVMADVSSGSNSDENDGDGPARPPPSGRPRSRQSMYYSMASMSPASSHFAAEAEIENIRGLKRELATLAVAIRSYPKKGQTWLLLHSYLDRAREELDAILQDVEIHPHTVHIVAPSGNLGLVVDKPTDDGGGGGGPVYVRSLHPMSPLRDRVWPRDKIVAIDGEDVQGLSPVEVGMLLCQTIAKDTRRMTIVRDDVLVGYSGDFGDANGARGPPVAADAGSEEEHSTSKDTSTEEEDEDRSEPERVDIPRSSTNDESEQKTGDLPPDRSRAAAVYEPLPNAIDSIMNAEAENRAYNEEPLPSAVELISNVKHFLRRLTEEEEGDDELAATSAPATAAPDSGMVEEEVNAWYSQFCRKKSGGAGAAANTTQDTIRTQVRAFKEKRLRRLESIERDDAKGTSRPSDEIAAGVAVRPPPPRSDEKSSAPASDDERKPPPSTTKQRATTASHGKERPGRPDVVEIRSNGTNEGGVVDQESPPAPRPGEESPAPPSNGGGGSSPSPRKRGPTERGASSRARDRLDRKPRGRPSDETDGGDDGDVAPVQDLQVALAFEVAGELAATKRKTSARDRVDRKPRRRPSDEIDGGDGGDPPPEERVATDDREASSAARESLDRKLSRRRQSRGGVTTDVAREMVTRIKSRNVERGRRSSIETEEAEGGVGGDVPVAEAWMW